METSEQNKSDVYYNRAYYQNHLERCTCTPSCAFESSARLSHTFSVLKKCEIISFVSPIIFSTTALSGLGKRLHHATRGQKKSAEDWLLGPPTGKTPQLSTVFLENGCARLCFLTLYSSMKGRFRGREENKLKAAFLLSTLRSEGPAERNFSLSTVFSFELFCPGWQVMKQWNVLVDAVRNNTTLFGLYCKHTQR